MSTVQSHVAQVPPVEGQLQHSMGHDLPCSVWKLVSPDFGTLDVRLCVLAAHCGSGAGMEPVRLRSMSPLGKLASEISLASRRRQ